MKNYIVLDLETGSKDIYGRKGNPWFNDIVAIGYKPMECKNAGAFDTSIFKYKAGEIFGLIDGYNVIIGHNIKYDLLYLWDDPMLLAWFAEGGEIWDTQLVEYIITNQQSKYPSLRETAVKYGCKAREKFMEEYWNKGIDTKDIPIELVIEDVKNDVLDTEAIYLKQLQIVKDLGMSGLVASQMDFLLAITEMEYNGMQIDKELFDINKKNLQLQIDQKRSELLSIIERHWK